MSVDRYPCLGPRHDSQEEAEQFAYSVKAEYAKHNQALPYPLEVYICRDVHFHVRFSNVW